MKRSEIQEARLLLGEVKVCIDELQQRGSELKRLAARLNLVLGRLEGKATVEDDRPNGGMVRPAEPKSETDLDELFVDDDD